MKRKNKFWKSLIALIGIGALFFLGVGLWATVYTWVYDHIKLTVFGSLGILALLLITKQLSWKKIKAKIVDIFT